MDKYLKYLFSMTVIGIVTFLLCRIEGTFLLSIFLIPLAVFIFFISIGVYSCRRSKSCFHFFLGSTIFLIILFTDKIHVQYSRISPLHYHNQSIHKIAKNLEKSLSYRGYKICIHFDNFTPDELSKKVDFITVTELSRVEIIKKFAKLLNCNFRFGGSPLGGTLSGGGYTDFNLYKNRSEK